MATAAKTTRKRKTRSSTNGRNDVLSVEGKDSKYEYRIVNDTPGRVAQMENRDWEIASGDEKLISTFDSSTDDSGSVKRRHVGDGTSGVLMRIRKDWFEEDKAEKARQADRLEQSTKADPNTKNGYGKVEIK